MKIVFMGTPDLAAEVLDTMMKSGCEVTLAVTQPDKPKGRGRGVVKTPVHECADKWGIPVFSPVKIREPEAVERLRQEAPDLIVVAAFGQILIKEILDLPRYGCVNVHASLLPKLRGAAPIQWAVINGDAVSGVTIMQMDEGLDTGDILTQEEIPLAPDETGESLYNKVARLGGELLVKTLPAIEAGELTPVPQDDSASTYASMLRRDMGNIDWSLPAAQIERLVRGLNSWPSAYTFREGKMLKIWKSCVSDREATGEPGTVAAKDKAAIYVNCGEGVLTLLEVQPEGKKRMAVQAFLLGYNVEAGQKFTSER
ncbi:MAG: methionyl-tRNA formyltransferase [Eubacteriales bacterium]|nr:methionyl-tRNA formyltransferase [Eubacteriales bacterium]